jgi:hypothetical protein
MSEHTLDLMKTPLGILNQFQMVNDRLIMPRGHGQLSGPTAAFFHRMTAVAGNTLRALNHEAILTYDFFDLLQLYYEWLLNAVGYPLSELSQLQESIARLLKAMEIKTPFSHDGDENKLGRIFVWLDRGERMAAQHELPIKEVIGKIKEYTGRASRKDKNEPEGPLDNPKATMHIYEYKKKVGNLELTYFYWQLRWEKSKIGGETDSLEKAAEDVYRCFYKNMSNLKLTKSLEPEHNKWIVLLGNWVTTEELKAVKRKDRILVIPDLATDDRDGQMFVMNYPDATKVKERVLPKDIRKTRAAHKGSVNPMDYIIELKSGTKIESSMDWYIYRPEDRAMGEVYCVKCESAGSIGSLGACYVRGQGLLCGPCINWKLEYENLDDSCYDLQ